MHQRPNGATGCCSRDEIVTVPMRTIAHVESRSGIARKRHEEVAGGRDARIDADTLNLRSIRTGAVWSRKRQRVAELRPRPQRHQVYPLFENARTSSQLRRCLKCRTRRIGYTRLRPQASYVDEW